MEMDRVTTALERHFGFSTFRPGQREVVDAILDGRPVLGVMPTGAGKSLCYQLPAVLLEGVTVVVSPLIALMKDQVDSLRERGVAAAFLNSSQDLAEQRAVLEAASRGQLKLLYVSPERFRFQGAFAAIQRLPIALFAIDEAHCISHWGHDFRPEYQNLGRVARELGVPRIAAFTATATEQVRHDIVRSLELRDPLVTVAGFLRPNLHLSVLPIQKMREKARYARQILQRAGGSAVVYCATRKNCEEAAAELLKVGLDAVVYHGGLDDEARSAAQEAFAARDDLVMVATNAFGMGVDKSNVRAVVHWDIPGSLDAYYQEAGRAGRDGAPAWCTLLFTYADTRVQEFFIDNGGEGLPADLRAARAEGERQKLRAMVRYAYEESCRHAAILRYFGDRVLTCDDHAGATPTCDNCHPEAGLRGIALAPAGGAAEVRAAGPTAEPRCAARGLDEEEEVIVQKALSAVARARGRLSARTLARVLKGSRSREILADPLVATKSHGILAGLSEATLLALLGALARAGCTMGRHPVLTPLGTDAMWRRARVSLDIPPFGERPVAAARSTAIKPGAGSPRVREDALGPLDEADLDLFRQLKQRRFEAARERGVPAFVVASNKLLEQLVTARPGASRDAWLALKGVGEVNVDPLREVFLPVLATED